MVNTLDQLKAALKAAEVKLVDYEKARAEVEGLRIAIAVMQGEPIPQMTGAKLKDFEDLGVTAAAKKVLRDAGAPLSTRDIADEVIRRGLQTTSKNFIATVYATLRNGRMFKRTRDNKWQLSEGGD